MTNAHQSNLESPDITEADLLLTRIVDGEATDADFSRFETIATEDPALWKLLAKLQQASAELARGMEERFGTVGADALDSQPIRHSAIAWAVSGWAAVLVLAVIWFAFGREPFPSRGQDPVRPVGQADGEAVPMTPDEHLEAYLAAPFVMGELEPIMLETEERPDGRIAVRLIRRIEEMMYIDAEEPLPTDDDGSIDVAPDDLRGSMLRDEPES